MLIAFALIGLLAGVISALFGIGGGIIVVPAMLLLAVPSKLAVICSIHMMVALTASSLMQFKKAKSFDFKFGLIMGVSSALGTLTGAKMVAGMGKDHHLTTDLLLLMIVIAMLLLQIREFVPKLKRLSLIPKLFSLPWTMPFEGCPAPASVIWPVILGLLAGNLLAVVGVGGSFIVIPLMLAILNFRVNLVSGTCHIMIFIASIMALASYSSHGIYPDLDISIPLLIGAVIGAVIGAELTKGVSERFFKIGFLILTMLVIAQVIYDLLHHSPQVDIEFQGQPIILTLPLTLLLVFLLNKSCNFMMRQLSLPYFAKGKKNNQ